MPKLNRFASTEFIRGPAKDVWPVFKAKIQNSKISKKARGTRAPPLLVPFRGLKIGQNFVEMVPGDRARHEDSENHLGKSKRRSDGRMVADWKSTKFCKIRVRKRSVQSCLEAFLCNFSSFSLFRTVREWDLKDVFFSFVSTCPLTQMTNLVP